MGFSYLQGKSWLDITREERLFCAFLYWDIRSREKDFVAWLNKNHGLQLDEEAQWEVGYEVCFYRDLLKSKGKSIINKQYSSKRTFDLCLFSESTIVVIEAKVQQGFEKSQIDDFKKDKDALMDITGNAVQVKFLALASSQYFDNYMKYGKGEKDLLDMFHARISWAQIYDSYNRRDLYQRADSIYKQ
jgi:hypothetical protein